MTTALAELYGVPGMLFDHQAPMGIQSLETIAKFVKLVPPKLLVAALESGGAFGPPSWDTKLVVFSYQNKNRIRLDPHILSVLTHWFCASLNMLRGSVISQLVSSLFVTVIVTWLPSAGLPYSVSVKAALVETRKAAFVQGSAKGTTGWTEDTR